MLTGDKVETATSIAISSGLKARRDKLVFMRELTDRLDCTEKLEEASKHIEKSILIIDGETLDTILRYESL